MAKVIELIGVSGVGKTSVFNKLKWGQAGLNSYCTYKQVVGHALIKSSPTNGWLRWLEYQLRTGLPPAFQTSAAARFIKDNPEFSRNVWIMISTKSEQEALNPGMPYNGIRLFYKNFAQHQLIKEYKEKKYVLMNEGLVQRFRSYRVSNGSEIDSRVQDGLGRLVSGVIYLDAPAETIEERASQKGGKYKITSKEKRLYAISEGIREYRDIIHDLEKDDVFCSCVDASGTLEETINNVNVVLRNLDSDYIISQC